MTLDPLPRTPSEFMNWEWPQLAPYYDELAKRDLSADNVESWLADWSQLTDLVSEIYSRLYVGTTVNTIDQDVLQQYNHFLDTIYPASEAAEHKLKEKLLASGLEPQGMETPLKYMRAEVELFRAENLALLSQEQKLLTEYQKIIGAQTVTWEGKEITLLQLAPVFQNPDRATRERAWHLAEERRLADRQAINNLWARFLRLRQNIAANAGFSNFRDYRWKQLRRIAYTPENCFEFHRAIEQVVVPAATRIYERGRKALGLDKLKPWDLTGSQGFGLVANPSTCPPLTPFKDVSELEAGGARIFERVDQQLGAYFKRMQQERLLDLANRKNKAPGAYSLSFETKGLPIIFENAVGVHNDVQTLLHESGHAFHTFETRHLPYFQQRSYRAIPMEFAEVASMSMELLAAPFLTKDNGGFYSGKDAAQARREHLESLILFWPYMAVVDAFQHWVYEHPEAAMDPGNCDAEWSALWQRFMPGVDYTGQEEMLRARWHRQLHIHSDPFYYVEYGLAQLGAVQVWRNARVNQEQAVAEYRRALSLGATVPLPQLFATAGAKFAFDAETLGEAVALIESVIAEPGDE